MKQSIIQTKKYTGNLRFYWLNFTLCSLFGKSGHAAHMYNLAFCLSDVYKSNTLLLLTNRGELNAFFSPHTNVCMFWSLQIHPTGVLCCRTRIRLTFYTGIYAFSLSYDFFLKGRYTSVRSWLYIETIPSPLSSWKAIYYPSCLYCLPAIPRRSW